MAELNDLLSNISNIKTDIKSAIENKGQNVTNFASYPNAISNIVSGGSGGVYQYSSLENMYNDVPNRSNGDIGVVYESSQAGITKDTIFQAAIFPETVVLESSFSDSASLNFMAVDESGYGLSGTISASGFTLNTSMWSNPRIEIQYTSSDGITYTRTTFTKGGNPIIGNTVEFETSVQFYEVSGWVEWNPITSNFIKADLTNFEGLFQYSGNNFSKLNSQLSAISEQVWRDKFYGINNIQIGSLNQITNLDIEQLKNKINLYSSISYLRLNNVLDMSNLFYNCETLISIPNLDTFNTINMSNMFSYCGNLITICNFNTSNVTNMSSMFYHCNKLSNIPNFDTSKVTNMSNMFYWCGYLANVPNFDTSKVTNMAGMFDSCSNKLVIIPNFNTINTINMKSMFGSCYNLANVPNFDTSNVIDMSNMFAGCWNLINIPNLNTINVTNMKYMFSRCRNLVNMINLNTINVIDVCGMFWYCPNLVNVPQFDTSNVTNVTNMFYNCNNLSDTSIQNIINMCLNSKVTNSTLKNLNNTNTYSPFYYTNISSSKYSNRLTELTQAGWTY